MNLGVKSDSKSINDELDQIYTFLRNLTMEMDKNTILAVTGNKASNVKGTISNLNEKMQHQEVTGILNEDIEEIKEQNKNIHTGLFMYSKRPSKYLYDYKGDKDLRLMCPNPNKKNKIKEFDKRSNGENSQYLILMNQLNRKD